MARILVLYDTRSGNTQKMAVAVAEGARSLPDVEVTMKHVDEAQASDLFEHDGMAVGSPTWCGGQELASCRILGAKLVTHVKRVTGE